MGDTSDRRSYFRVEDHVNLLYTQLAPDEARAFAKRLEEGGAACSHVAELRGLSAQMSNTLAAIRKTDPAVALYLGMLDKKIDAVAKMVEEQRLGTDLAPNAHVNIGAGGMVFPSDTDLPDGSELDLRLIFFPSYFCIRTLGRVVRSERASEGESGKYTIGVEFAVIGEESQEALIRHLTERQSALLRQRQRN